MMICLGLLISTLLLHFTQYACAILSSLLSFKICAEAITYVSVRQCIGEENGTAPGPTSSGM